ncbi:MAG: GPP34 family phosphoprotein [Planctomycetota bacterium]|nr:GPP34 family phosphoprotein [Planctomycetota bacterium]
MRTETDKRLFLHEEVLLLALQDEKGVVAFGTMCEQVLGGAMLAELLLQGKVVLEQSGRKKLVVSADGEFLGDPLLDECLTMIDDEKKMSVPQAWVSRFAGIKELKYRTARTLCRRGVLREDEEQILLIFSRRVYPEVNPLPEREIIERLRQAIFSDTNELDPRTIVLIALADGAGLLSAAFDRRELKSRKSRTKMIVDGDIVGQATQEVIQFMQAAATIAAIMPIMTMTAINS